MHATSNLLTYSQNSASSVGATTARGWITEAGGLFFPARRLPLAVLALASALWLGSLALPAAAAAAGVAGAGPAEPAAAAPASQERRGRVGTQNRSGSGRHGSGGRGYSRGHRSGGHRHYGGHYRYRYYPRYYGYYGYYGWGFPYYYGAYGYGGGYRGAPYRVGGAEGYAFGALDLDISPEKAAVYVDGVYVGIADNYDGFPRYLWLEEGDHRLVFHLDGYRTVTREYTVRAGVVLEIDSKMEEGETQPPEELFDKPTTRADQRIERDQQAKIRVERAERQGRSSGRRHDEGWRERRDLRSEGARLVLEIEPLDAVAYLDGRLLGSGHDLEDLGESLLIDAGQHVLEVVHPSHDTKRIEFEAEPGEEVELSAEL